MKAQLEKIAAYVAEHCSADDYRLFVGYGESHETRFAQNAITQHIAGQYLNLYLNVSYGTQSGSASSNQYSPEDLDRLISSAQDMALMNRPDPEFIGTEPAHEVPVVPGAADATLALNPEKMVDIVKACITNAEMKEAMVSGMTEKHLSQSLCATKNGFYGYYTHSNFGHSMTMKKDAVETKVSISLRDFADFKLKDQIAKLNSQFDALSAPHDFDACKIPVILRPAALLDLLGYLGWTMDRRSADEGFTPFTDQLGKAFFGADFSMASLITDPQLSCTPFSHEGLPSEDIWWIKDGILQAMPCNRYWASKCNEKPRRNMFNIYIPGGDKTEHELMQMVPRGLIVNRFWYIRSVDGKTGELTGMTRDGVLYFENGEIKHSVNNLRWNEIPHLVTHRILGKTLSEMVESEAKLPAMLVDDFNFVDKTSF